jgi:hypothetical protein
LSGIAVSAIALVAFMFPTLIASIWTLETEGKNNALPILWVMVAIGWIVWLTVYVTLGAIEGAG